MRTFRSLAVATATAALSVTVLSGAAQATPPAHAPAHGHAAKASGVKHGDTVKAAKADRKAAKGKDNKGAKPAKATKADRNVAKVVTTARVLTQNLYNAGTAQRLRGLSETSVEAIRANITTDRDTIVALVETVKADPTQAGSAYATLRGYKTANYAIANGQARAAERLVAYAATIAERVAVEAPDAQATYDQALVVLDNALLGATSVTATSTRTDIAAVSADLREGAHLLAQVRDALDAEDTDSDDTVDSVA